MLALLFLPVLLAADPGLASQDVRIARDRAGTTGRLTVRVSDEHGAGVRGLRAEDFAVVDDGEPLGRTLLDRAATSRHTGDFRSEVVVVVGPMDVPSRAVALRQVRDLVRALRREKGARVQIIDGPTVIQAATADMTEAERALAAQCDPAEPRTGDVRALRRPIEGALARLSDLPGSRSALVYLLQHDALSLDTFLVPQARDAGVAVYPVLLRPVEVAGGFSDIASTFPLQAGEMSLLDITSSVADRSSDAYGELRGLDDLARATGGRARLGDARALAEVVAGSRGVYTLDCAITPTLADGQVHVIAVDVRRPKLTVRALGQYLSR